MNEAHMHGADTNGSHLNEAMDCAQARMHFALLLYGELSFDEEEGVDAHLDGCAGCRAELERQKSLHAALDGLAVEPPASLLRTCRADLAAALRHTPFPRTPFPRPLKPDWRERFWDFAAGGGLLRPAGALALVLLGFLGARLLPILSQNILAGALAGANQAGISRVSDIEAQSDGTVRIVVDQIQRKTITGGLDDQEIRTRLLEAAGDPNNDGLRADSVDLLTRRAQSAEIRGTLVNLVVHDQNDGVRLKAMEGLKPYVAEPEVREALSRALLGDANPGVRRQAIDLLIQAPAGNSAPNLDSATIGMLQQLMSRERNASVRQRAEKALELMNASAEIY
jgi:hypothetical protein